MTAAELAGPAGHTLSQPLFKTDIQSRVVKIQNENEKMQYSCRIIGIIVIHAYMYTCLVCLHVYMLS